VTDKRAVFFLVAAVACFVLTPVADAELRWVAWGLGIIYLVLAVASWVDERSRRRSRR
jgi:hypothetical protein